LALILALSLLAGGAAAPSTAAGATPDELGLVQLVLEFIKAHYPGQWDLDTLIDSAAKGLVGGLGDPHSAYLSPDEYNSLISGLSGGFGGLGIYIDDAADGYIVIISPIKGTPADRVGLKPGDKIVDVDGRDIRNLGVSAVSKMLRGEPGTQVTVGIMRQGVPGLLYFEITRAWIEINPVEYEMVENGIGYINLSTFSELATYRVDQAIAALKAEGARAIVLDLRNNGGGLLDQATSVAERFLRSGQAILSIVRKTGSPEVVRAMGNHYLNLPVSVLVNEGTASASEILAGAIRDNQMGTVVGMPTYGKGSIQNIWMFTNGGGLKLTTAEYFTPSGDRIQSLGIVPEVVVEPEDYLWVVPYLAWYRPIRHMRVGLDALELEEVLHYLGELRETPDGVYGMVSVEAVKRIQKRSGLLVTGVVDEATAAALNDAAFAKAEAEYRDVQLERAVELLKAELLKKEF
jgi:carboxyl-terminal processing protease